MSNENTDSPSENISRQRRRGPLLRRVIVILILSPVALVALGAIYNGILMAADARKFPPPGALVDVDGHRLHINSMGEGSPTVVLEAGAGGSSLDWAWVQPELAKITRVCTYDRAGLGWSETGPLPRTSRQIVEELHRLLSESGEKPPFILVGHSFGGMTMKLFAATYPEEVAGLVLVDGIHEDFFSRMPPEVGDGVGAQLRMLSLGRMLAVTGLPRLLMPPLAPRGLPDDAQAAANALGYRPKVYGTVRDEARSFETSADYLREATNPRKDLPLAILSRTVATPWPPNVNAEDAERIWQELQSAHKTFSDNVTQIRVEESSHYINIEQPQTVVQAIQAMIDELNK
jgi:pimeloyl-ACP methyl ester carboxylesterase